MQDLVKRVGGFIPKAIPGYEYLKALRSATAFMRGSKGEPLRNAKMVELLRPVVTDSSTVRRLRVGDEVLYTPVLDGTVIAGKPNPPVERGV